MSTQLNRNLATLSERVGLGRLRRMSFLLLATLNMVYPITASADVGDTRALVEQWVETQRIIAEERNQWAVEKAALVDLKEVLLAESDSLAANIAAVQDNLSATDGVREDLVNRRDALRQATRRFGRQLTAVENQLADIVDRLPPPLAVELRQLIGRLQQRDSASGQPALSRRLQTVLALLAAIEDFDRAIHVSTGMLERDDGRQQEVDFVFIGLGAGYFIDASGEFCGRLTVTDDGWEQHRDPSLASTLTTFIAAYRDPAKAQFIPLPVSNVPLIPIGATEQ